MLPCLRLTYQITNRLLVSKSNQVVRKAPVEEGPSRWDAVPSWKYHLVRWRLKPIYHHRESLGGKCRVICKPWLPCCEPEGRTNRRPYHERPLLWHVEVCVMYEAHERKLDWRAGRTREACPPETSVQREWQVVRGSMQGPLPTPGLTPTSYIRVMKR